MDLLKVAMMAGMKVAAKVAAMAVATAAAMVDAKAIWWVVKKVDGREQKSVELMVVDLVAYWVVEREALTAATMVDWKGNLTVEMLAYLPHQQIEIAWKMQL